jgi:hypothetical protein
LYDLKEQSSDFLGRALRVPFGSRYYSRLSYVEYENDTLGCRIDVGVLNDDRCR